MAGQPPVLQDTLGNRIRFWRKTNLIKQEALAEILGVSQAIVSKWERDIAIPSPGMRVKIKNLVNTLNKDIERAARSIMPLESAVILFDYETAMPLAFSSGVGNFWPEMAQLKDKKLRDLLANESRQLLEDPYFRAHICDGEIYAVGGQSNWHLDLGPEYGGRKHHKWHAIFREFGSRNIVEMHFGASKTEDTGILVIHSMTDL